MLRTCLFRIFKLNDSDTHSLSVHLYLPACCSWNKPVVHSFKRKLVRTTHFQSQLKGLNVSALVERSRRLRVVGLVHELHDEVACAARQQRMRMGDNNIRAKQHHLPFGIFAWEEKLTVYSEPDGALSSANQTAGKNVLPPSPLRLISNMDCAEHHT